MYVTPIFMAMKSYNEAWYIRVELVAYFSVTFDIYQTLWMTMTNQKYSLTAESYDSRPCYILLSLVYLICHFHP